MWIKLPVINDSNVSVNKMVNLKAYRIIEPYDNGNKTKFIEAGGAGAIVLEGVESGNFIADIAYETLANQIASFTAGFDNMGNFL